MKELIAQCIALFFDWVPYAIGRVALFILSLGQLKCEKWEPLIWDTDLFGKCWWHRVEGKTVVTHIGVRWAGSIVLTAAVLIVAVPLIWLITKIW